jgi:light-regulated signal transduction histidine kinase (bacteriophytochrome)
MRAMLDGILEYARAGREGRALAPVDFNRALEEALENLRARIEETGAEVRHTTLPVLPGEYRQVVQLFQNLVGNALKFQGVDPPRVVIGARERESDWRFAVKDNGIGIDPRFHQRIFGMFQRLHTAEEFPGTGVGLALCKRIVERHGGELWVHSAPGEGATFFFTIPKQAAASEAEAVVGP